MTNLADIAFGLAAAKERAEISSDQLKRVMNGPAGVEVETETGPVPTVKEFLRRNQAEIDQAKPENIIDDAQPQPLKVFSSEKVATTVQQVRDDVGDATDPDKGAAMVGWRLGVPGAIGRTQADKNSEIVSAKDFGAVGDGTLHTVQEWIIPGAMGWATSLSDVQQKFPHVQSATDSVDWAAIQAGLSAGYRVYIPDNHEFVTNRKIIPVAGAGLVGDGEGSRIRLGAVTTESVLDATGVNGFFINGIVLDGDNTLKASGSHGIKATACNGWEIVWLKIVRPQNWGVAFYAGSTDNRIGTLIVEDAKTSSALMFSGSSGNKVGKLISKRCGGFGAQIFDESHENQIDVIEAEDGGLEALGINSRSHRNRVGSVFALRSGDNGVSISGQGNVVTTVYADGVRFHGICFYGSRNVVGTVFARNVGKNAGVPYAGVAFSPAFGGTGSDNIVGSAFAIDDQSTPTMDYAIWATNNTDVAWTAGATVGPASWRKYNNRIYQTALGGSTGSTPPTHISGTVSDGAVEWTYMLDATPATRNKVGPTTAFGYTNTKFAGTNLGNFFGDESGKYSDITFGAAFGLRREALPWASGQSVGFSTWRSNAGNVYVCTNAGGSTSSPPTHTSGTVAGSDGIAWRFVEETTSTPAVLMTTDGAQFNGKVRLVNVTNGVSLASIVAGNGTPEAMVSDGVSSLYLRTDGQVGNEAYIHTATFGTANWETVMLRRRGPSANRPTVPSGGAFGGIPYFDTTLMKPIWSNTTGGWIDANSNPV